MLQHEIAAVGESRWLPGIVLPGQLTSCAFTAGACAVRTQTGSVHTAASILIEAERGDERERRRLGLTDAERARLERRRDRIMALLKESDAGKSGPTLDAEDRKDLVEEWHRIDNALERDR